MPTLTDKTNRHIIIDRRDGEYLCFPDIICSNGRLIVAYNEAEQHVCPKKRDLLVRLSDDNGHTWGNIHKASEKRSHCPRLNKLADGTLHMISGSNFQHFSTDNGTSWDTHQMYGMPHDMVDRIIQLDGEWLTTGHAHRGSHPQPAIRQAPAEQMVYRSENQGENWFPVSILARERNLVLCEASMLQLPDGRILSLMRENSFVYEPMYTCLSDDDGCTWSDPKPTPLIGHRPTVGLTSDGNLLVTYRNVAPDKGTCAWLGTLDELMSDFQVHGRHPAPLNPTLTAEGLRIHNDVTDDLIVRYALRPLTDPRSATATLEAEVRVDEAGKNGCGMRLGVWWRIYPDKIIPEIKDAEAIFIEPDRFNVIRLEYADGKVTLSINDEKRITITIEADDADTRPIMFGAPYPFEKNEVDATWKRVSLATTEPHLQRNYTWTWTHTDGLPDQWMLDNILELKNDRNAAAPDFGYTGWAELPDGSFFCTYHHGGWNEEGYDPLFTSYIMGTRFTSDDFK
jgi:hypothetical protein